MSEGAVVTGVIQNNRVAWLHEEMFNSKAVNLTYEEALQDHKLTCDDEECKESDHDVFCESWEDNEDTYLIGDFEWNDETMTYEADIENGEYMAMVRGTVTQVLWSKRMVRVRSWSSSWYPKQADLDSGLVERGGILAYHLPEDIVNE